MSRLWAFEYRATLRQAFSVSRVSDVVYVRPHLYVHGNPAGTVRMDIRDANGKIVASSAAVSIGALFPSSDGYRRGYRAFTIAAHLEADTVYYLHMVCAGYAFTETDYIAWCNGFDFGWGSETYSAKNGPQSALHFELWSRKRYDRGTV